MYLKDDDMAKSLKDCKDNLTFNKKSGKSGLIFIKENVSDDGFFDADDNSSARSKDSFRSAFEKAGFEIIHESKSPFTDECYDLYMWVLRASK